MKYREIVIIDEREVCSDRKNFWISRCSILFHQILTKLKKNGFLIKVERL